MRNIFSILMLFLILTRPILATLTYYVNTDVVGGAGDGSSLANAYSTSQAAESAREADITGEAGGALFLLYATSGTADSALAISGDWVTDADSPVTFQIMDANYKWGVADSTILTIGENYVRIIGYSGSTNGIELTSIAGNDRRLITISGQDASNDIRLINLVLKGPDNDSYYPYGIIMDDADSLVTLNNCLIYNLGQNANTRGIGYITAGGNMWIYNCTVDNCYMGIRAYGSGSDIICKNVIVSGSDDAAYSISTSGTIAATNCSSDDATVDTFDTGTTCFDSVTPTYEGTYQLASGDSTWINSGLDLGSDGNWFVGSDIDWEGTVRGTWDIGWDERVESSGLKIPIAIRYYGYLD